MSYYKDDPRDVALNGIDIGTFVAALYNNALTGGAGLMRFDEEQMTPDEGTHIFTQLQEQWRATHRQNRGTILNLFNDPVPADRSQGICFDYINGRSIKTWFHWDRKNNVTMSFSRFWDYNHMPVANVLALAQKGIYGKMGRQSFLDTRNEARILLQDDGQCAIFDAAVEKISERLSQDDALYISEHPGRGHKREGYQISLAGNDTFRGEVGFTVPAFNP